ncbi:MAG: helix-hairpin-helix domain-containing protein [Acidobacteriota bacterium]
MKEEDSMCRAIALIGFVVAALLASPPVSSAQMSKAQAPKTSAAKASPAGRVRATPASPVNINAATAAQLQTLPGVGASTAQRILDYRQKNGGFKKIEELMNVRGVGEKSFLKLKPLIVISGERAAAADASK